MLILNLNLDFAILAQLAINAHLQPNLPVLLVNTVSDSQLAARHV